MNEIMDVIMFCIMFVFAFVAGGVSYQEERILNWTSLILMILSVGIGYKLVFGS